MYFHELYRVERYKLGILYTHFS